MLEAPAPATLLAGTQRPVRLTMLGFRTEPDQLPNPVHPPDLSTLGLGLRLPDSRDQYTTRCLALGIGASGEGTIAALASADWFAHLRGTISGPLHGTVPTLAAASGLPEEIIGVCSTPHVASIALGSAPSESEVGLACDIGKLLRSRGAFVVVTTAFVTDAVLLRIGQACDCIVGGDGSDDHDHYPIRAVIWPAGGRLVCYDLYDVLSMWAGRLGRHGAARADSDAMHVEVSASFGSLYAVDEIATKLLGAMKDDGERLVSVVDSVRDRAAVSTTFTRNSYVQQSRVPAQSVRVSRVADDHNSC